jgi:hypothetical protein
VQPGHLDDSRLNTSMNKTEPIATVAANHLGRIAGCIELRPAIPQLPK